MEGKEGVRGLRALIAPKIGHADPLAFMWAQQHLNSGCGVLFSILVQ